jgi:hypothetical protein
MRTIKTYSIRAPFDNAFIRTLTAKQEKRHSQRVQ